MTREQVAEWADKHGRLTYLNKNDSSWNKIEIKTGPLHLYFETKEEILKDEYLMKEPVWDIGWRILRSDIWFAWRVRFENDVVLENTYTMIFDGLKDTYKNLRKSLTY